MRARSSGSGLLSLACCHWKRASSWRPTRLPEISLGLVPLLYTLKSNAAIIIDGPVVTLRRRDESDGGIVGIGRRREFLIVAIEIAERHQRLIILRVAVGQRLEQRLRL